jgi:hypothetical protein
MILVVAGTNRPRVEEAGEFVSILISLCPATRVSGIFNAYRMIFALKGM